MTPLPEVLTTGDVARAFGVSTSAVRQWIRAGRLKCFRTPTGHARMRREVVERLLVESSDAATDPA